MELDETQAEFDEQQLIEEVEEEAGRRRLRKGLNFCNYSYNSGNFKSIFWENWEH